MRSIQTLGVIGGDLRSFFLAQALVREGYTVLTYGLEQAELPNSIVACISPEQAVPLMDAVIFPVPVSADDVHLHAPLARTSVSLERLFQAASPEQKLFGGQISSAVEKKIRCYGLQMEDYYRREDLAVYNAVPAAEGAIQLAMEELPITLHCARTLITGCGRVGRALAQRLVLLGARVTVAARRQAELAWAYSIGCSVLEIRDLEKALPTDVIFNTVPAKLFTASLLRRIGRDTLLIDLASKPGGVDWDAAAALHCRTIWALSLPGRVAPKTAGEILATAVLHSIGEVGEEKR